MSTCNFTGKPLSMTPRWALAAGGEYRQKLGPLFSPAVTNEMIGYFGADFTWQSAYFSGSDDSIYSLIEPYGLLNLHIGVTPDSGAWDLSVFVKNALDKRYWVTVSAGTSLAAGVIGGNPGDPLTAGVTLKARF
jgi:iron complex outermembrane receptor protein